MVIPSIPLQLYIEVNINNQRTISVDFTIMVVAGLAINWYIHTSENYTDGIISYNEEDLQNKILGIIKIVVNYKFS